MEFKDPEYLIPVEDDDTPKVETPETMVFEDPEYLIPVEKDDDADPVEVKPTKDVAPDVTEIKTYEDFTKDKELISEIEKYAASRFGDDGKRLTGETDKEYFRRFLTHTRRFETNSVDLMGQLDWLRDSSQEDVARFGNLYRELQKLPDFYEEGGAPAGRAVLDYAVTMLSDPITVLTAGAGRAASMAARPAIQKIISEVGTQAARKQAQKAALRGARPVVYGAAVGEAGVGVAQSYGLQEVEKEADVREESSDLEALVSGAIGGGAGLLFGRQGVKGAAVEIVDELTKRKAKEEVVKEAVQRQAKEAVDEDTAELYEFNPVNGYEILSKLNRTELTEPQLQVELQQRIGKVALEVLKESEAQGRDLSSIITKEATARDVAGKILSQEVDIDADILSGALNRAGLSEEDFLDVAGVSLTDAARTMQSYSEIGKFMKKIRELDPKVAKRIEDMYGKQDKTVGIFGRAHQFMQRLDRERRALMVTQLSTTARNVATGVMRLGIEGGANFMESTIYHLGKSVNSLMDGTASFRGVKNGWKDIARDTFGTLVKLNEYGYTKELSQALLQHNPKLARTLDRSLQEVGADEDLSKATRFFNKLNMTQDLFFRRAVFLQSVEKQLRRGGVDFDEFRLSGKALPTDVLQRATDEALSFTFSRMPKQKGGKIGDSIGYHFVKINEALGPLPGAVGVPVGTGAFPFARFMVNAMQFQLEYSPLNFGSSISAGPKMMRYMRGMAKEGDEAALTKAREDFSKATVGLAALSAAIYYRGQNQDIRWYEAKTDDGRTVDTRPFFPIAPYLMVADLFVKWDSEQLNEMSVREVMEGLTGAQMRAGLSSYMADSIFDFIDKSGGPENVKTEKLGEFMGGYMGELAGGFLTPGRVVSDVIAQFDKEEAYVRDPRQTDGFGAVERALSAAGNQILRNIPVAKRSLPVAESPTREGPMIRQSPVLKQITGVNITQRQSDIERELIDKGYKSYQVVTSTGDKTADAYVKQQMGPLVENYLAQSIDNDKYRNSTKAQQKAILSNRLKKLRSVAKDLGEKFAIEDSENNYTAFDRAKWSRTPNNIRDLADEFYMERNGKTVAQMQKEEPDVNHYAIGVLMGRKLSKSLK